LLATKRIALRWRTPSARPQALKRQEFGTLWSGACEYTNYPPNKQARRPSSVRRIVVLGAARYVPASCIRRTCACAVRAHIASAMF
jgi:hypothetical protein